MHYVKQFSINGVDTKQVACIELQGKPNAATEGYVGVLGIDMISPLHEVYKCVAVNGSIYTWELLSSGMSTLTSTTTGNGEESFLFPYSEMKIPSGYLIKNGDLIIDSRGYLYQVSSIGVDSCSATYCGTQFLKGEPGEPGEPGAPGEHGKNAVYANGTVSAVAVTNYNYTIYKISIALGNISPKVLFLVHNTSQEMVICTNGRYIYTGQGGEAYMISGSTTFSDGTFSLTFPLGAGTIGYGGGSWSYVAIG